MQPTLGKYFGAAFGPDEIVNVPSPRSPNKTVTCVLDGCTRVFSTESNMKQHCLMLLGPHLEAWQAHSEKVASAWSAVKNQMTSMLADYLGLVYVNNNQDLDEDCDR